MYGNLPARWRQRRGVDPAGWRELMRSAGAWRLVTRPGREATPHRSFTLHVCFEAGDVDAARDLAVGYAEALSLLRPEVALGAAALSYADGWHRAVPLFCGAVGPDDERCVDVFGHPGFHHGPGVGSLGWGDGDAPADRPLPG